MVAGLELFHPCQAGRRIANVRGMSLQVIAFPFPSARPRGNGGETSVSFMKTRWYLLALSVVVMGAGYPFQPVAAAPAEPSPWADWVESDFPFFSNIIDARQSGPVSTDRNLTPRGLVLNLGNGVWVGFDVDLLRVAAIWDGGSITPKSQAPRTYHSPYANLRPPGKSEFGGPEGTVWLANDIYPGWQLGDRFSDVDPREPQPSPEEVGRGPLAADHAQFTALRLVQGGVRLEYTVGGVPVRERMRAHLSGKAPAVERRLRILPSTKSMLLVLAGKSGGEAGRLFIELAGDAGMECVELREEPGASTIHIAPHAQPLEFRVAMSREPISPQWKSGKAPVESDAVAPARWTQTPVTRGVLSTSRDAYVVDEIPLPHDNPWRRHVRLADIQFLSGGRGVAVALDGDVWLLDGLEGNLEKVQWRRFASGFHEPLGVALRNEQMYVYDRNGIWCVRDTNGDGEADVHELFSNRFTQTCDGSDMPNSIKLAPDGSFVITKGGQRRKTYSRDAGTAMRISADGRTTTILGHGLRQPFAGVHPRTGLITVSDQDGHNVPATPIYILEGNRNHGYPRTETLSQIEKKFHLPAVYPPDLADPLLWMPRAVNSSAITQTWLVGAKMGPLNDAMIHIGYARPELLVVRTSERTLRRHGAAMSLTRELKFPPLSGSVNPKDGQFYVAGFILSNSTRNSHGLARLRYTENEYAMPREVVAMDKGFLLRFDVPLDPQKAANPDNYSIGRWNYRRTPNYASPPYRLDGTMGKEIMTPSIAYVSSDGKNVFVGIRDMKPAVMQMQINWELSSRAGTAAKGEAVVTPWELAKFTPASEGFGDLVVDLSPPAKLRVEVEEPVSAAAGGRLARSIGCYGCHSTDGSKSLAPTWKGLAGSIRTLKTGEEVIADEPYLRESIIFPSAKVVAGYEEGMPGFAGIIGESQLESIIMYIKSRR